MILTGLGWRPKSTPRAAAREAERAGFSGRTPPYAHSYQQPSLSRTEGQAARAAAAEAVERAEEQAIRQQAARERAVRERETRERREGRAGLLPGPMMRSEGSGSATPRRSQSAPRSGGKRSASRSPRYESPRRLDDDASPRIGTSPRRESPRYNSPHRRSPPAESSPLVAESPRYSSPRYSSPRYSSPENNSPMDSPRGGNSRGGNSRGGSSPRGGIGDWLAWEHKPPTQGSSAWTPGSRSDAVRDARHRYNSRHAPNPSRDEWAGVAHFPDDGQLHQRAWPSQWPHRGFGQSRPYDQALLA